MSYKGGLRPGEMLIDDSTPEYVTHATVIDGELKGRGLVPRNYSTHPAGYLACAPAWSVDMPLIPRSEWSDRIKEMVETKSLLSDIRLTGNNGQIIPSLDQDGYGYCHTADTEVLTDRGWVGWPDYNYSDLLATVNPATGMMEFQAPFERHVYPYDGEMIYSTNRRLDFGVTPDHRMLVRKWDESARTLSDRYTFQRAGEIGWYAGLMHAPSGYAGTELRRVAVPGDREYDGDDFVALLALLVSDGFAGGSEGERKGKGTRSLVSFAAFRPDRREKTAALAARIGFREAPSRPGVWNRWDAGALAEWVRANCYVSPELGAKNKCVPPLVKCLSRRQIELFIDFFGDRSYRADQEAYYSTSKRLTDDLQELLLRVGRRGSIVRADPKETLMPQGKVCRSGELYTLHVSKTNRLCIDRKKHVERERYRGEVYCAAVPNGTLVTRRNGSVLISGNCWAHSTTSAVMMLRAANNAPYVGLSAFAVAAVIKGWRDEGGWGAQSLEFITSRGVPSEKFWPMRSMNRANDNPQTWENAKLHRVSEGWVDLGAAQYNRNLTFDQAMTCLLCRIPVVTDLNWWSHSVCAIDPVEVEKGSFGIRILNSWGDAWSDRGMGVLSGSRAVMDGGAAPRVVTPSVV